MLFRPAFVNDGWPRGLAQTQILGSMKADAYEVNIVGAEHRSFMDARFLFPESQTTSTGPRRVLHITSAYARAFLAKHLGSADRELLEGPSADFPDVYLRSLRSPYPAGGYDRLKDSLTP